MSKIDERQSSFGFAIGVVGLLALLHLAIGEKRSGAEPAATAGDKASVGGQTARPQWKSFALEFLAVSIIFAIVVGLLVLIPTSRSYIRDLLTRSFGGKLPFLCSVVGIAVALMNGFFQQLFLDLELAGRRVAIFLSFSVLIVLLVGGASGYLQDKEAKERTLASMDETLKTLTGADSYPYMLPELNHGKIDFAIYNDGKYEVYDIFVQVTDNIAFSEQTRPPFRGKPCHDSEANQAKVPSNPATPV